MIPQELTEDLKESGYLHEIKEEGQRIFIIFKEYALPLGIYNLEKSDLMIFTTPFYPNAGFDMFWVDEQLRRKDGSFPKSANVFEPYMGKNWLRFSYHPYQEKPWDPASDSVIRYISYVDQRLGRGD